MSDNFPEDTFEIQKKTGRFDGSFVMLYGCEITDKRITPGAKMLKHWLEFRCGGNYKNNFVSKKALARDFGVSKNTIKRWLEELQNIGALKIYKRSDGKEIKVIQPIEDIYGFSFVISFRNLVSDKYKNYFLQHCLHLQSEICDVDVTDVPPDQKFHGGVNYEPYEEDDDSPTYIPHPGAITGTVAGSISDPNMVTNIAPGVTFGQKPVNIKYNIDQSNQDVTHSEKTSEVEELSRRNEVEEIKSRRNKVEERIRSHSSEIPNGISSSFPAPSDPHDQILDNGISQDPPSSYFRKQEPARLVDDDATVRGNAIAEAMARDADRAAEARQKLYNKQQRVSPEARAQRDADKEKARKEHSINKPWTWKRLEKEVWSLLFQDHYPGVKRSSWEKRPEGELAEKLVKDYGVDILRQAFATLFEQWHFIKKKTFPYSKDPEKWVIPDFLFFDRPEAQQFLAGIKIIKPKIVNRINGQSKEDDKKSGLW